MRRNGLNLVLPIIICLHFAYSCCPTNDVMDKDKLPLHTEDSAATIFSNHQTTRLTWSLATTSPVYGSVLVVHGLNNRPSVMDPLTILLNSTGYHVLRLALSGHQEGESWPDGSSTLYNLWLENIATACDELLRASPNEPRFFLAFSTGATSVLRYLDLHPSYSIKAMFLLSPAVSLTATAGFIRAITPLRVFGIALPSLAPRRYRAHGFTSLSAYQGLLDLAGSVSHINNYSSLNSIPTVIAMSSEDRLINFSGVKRWLTTNQLTAWSVMQVYPEAKLSGLHQHVILDADSLGDNEWKRLTTAILHLFRNSR